jgi:hypothetical protein
MEEETKKLNRLIELLNHSNNEIRKNFKINYNINPDVPISEVKLLVENMDAKYIDHAIMQLRNLVEDYCFKCANFLSWRKNNDKNEPVDHYKCIVSTNDNLVIDAYTNSCNKFKW